MKVSFIVEGQSGPGNRRSGSLPLFAPPHDSNFTVSQGSRASLGGPERCPRSLSACVARPRKNSDNMMKINKNMLKLVRSSLFLKNMAKLVRTWGDHYLLTWGIRSHFEKIGDNFEKIGEKLAINNRRIRNFIANYANFGIIWCHDCMNTRWFSNWGGLGPLFICGAL